MRLDRDCFFQFKFYQCQSFKQNLRQFEEENHMERAWNFRNEFGPKRGVLSMRQSYHLTPCRKFRNFCFNGIVPLTPTQIPCVKFYGRLMDNVRWWIFKVLFILVDRLGSMPHPMTMTVWSMHWRLVSKCYLITRSFLESPFHFPNLVTEIFWPFIFPFWNVNLERMSSCHYLYIICQILRAVALFSKSRVVSELSRVLSVLSRVVSVLSRVVLRVVSVLSCLKSSVVPCFQIC